MITARKRHDRQSGPPACPALSLPVLFLALLLGCNLSEPVDPLPESDADGAAEADVAPGDGARGDVPSADGTSGGGAATYVTRSFSIVTARVCDLDDDGDMDNAVADLGAPAAEILAGALTAALGAVVEGNTAFRSILHFPWVDDLATFDDAELLGHFGDAIDTDGYPDGPAYPEDDFSGDEPYYVSAQTGRGVDACGEPLWTIRGGLEAGHFDGRAGFNSGIGDLPFTWSRALGELETSRGALLCCGYSTIAELGGSPVSEDDGRLFLEVLTAGGESLGMSSIPGLEPNLDLDGDGLERIRLSEDGTIASCIDGDASVIDGPDCWQDARMADAFSLVFEFSLVSARFAGIQPGWEQIVDGECTDPPEQSLWDPP